MYEAIESARESVYLEMYIFEDNIDNFDFFKLLQEKAKKGIRVRIILDYFGSFSFSNASISKLKEAGAELLLLHGAHNLIRSELDSNISFLDIMRKNLNNLKLGLKCRK